MLNLISKVPYNSVVFVARFLFTWYGAPATILCTFLLSLCQSRFSPSPPSSPDFIRDSLSDSKEGRIIASITNIKDAGHLVRSLSRSFKCSFVEPNQGCTGATYCSCGGDCGHPRWNQSYAATKALIAGMPIPNSYIENAGHLVRSCLPRSQMFSC